MRPKHIIMAAVAATVALGITGQAGAQQTTLNVATAGSQNMVDYVTDYLGPMFEKANPGVKVRTVGTGPGDAGSQKIFEKLSAQQKAGNQSWDMDVAVVHQKMAGTLVNDDNIAAYLSKGVRFTMTSWNAWVIRGASEFLERSG